MTSSGGPGRGRVLAASATTLGLTLLAGCGMVSVSRTPSAEGTTGSSVSHPSSSVSPSTRPSTTAPPGPVIVIDPGHSGHWTESRTTNGLRDVDYPTEPEMAEVFTIGDCVGRGLRADGYRVVLTKHHVGDTVSLTERARIADRARAALAVSIHDDHSQGTDFQAVYSQRGLPVGGKYPVMYRGSGSSRTVFAQPSVARASEKAAALMAKARTRAQGTTVRVAQNSFSGRPPLEPGNLALVQLLSHVPWVYNEAGAGPGAMGVPAQGAYAKGLLDGIEAAVPVAGRVGSPTSLGDLTACLKHR